MSARTLPAPLHAGHPDILKRLRRIEGHVRSVAAMIEEDRRCLDLAQQLHAIERAVSEAKRALIHDHLNDCLDAALAAKAGARRDTLEEFRAIAKYL
jgi:hypothetical protein NreA